MLRLQLAAANSEGSSAGQGKNCGEEYNTNNTENGDAGEIITSSNLSGSSGHHHLRPLATVPEEEARQVILRLAAVSPSIYIDGILARIEDEDETAIEELAIVLQLTESETVGISG